ncbi:hypothetical protein TNIN_40911 [Trichonephila inaurata madagascariensis]|uniref:Kazal-like domain-containing protein n=1 Tax=Trichonephila inaurata madagascariensis TaxID=2747483 RepID=A0A8X7CAM4_9ARAC|nr:hypothetical protein TNIN_40911 [Trichonephila inaurata madagascariensis]
MFSVKKAQKILLLSDLCINVHCKYGARCEDGRCVCPTECPENYDPVCSSDGTTYRNECEMRRAACEQTMELNVLIYGECEDVGGSGAGIKSPESGSGNSPCDKDACRYGGICDYDSEDRLLCVCAFECPPIRAPVCGSDGEFYDSDCKMKEQSCKTQKKIVIVPKNKCQIQSFMWLFPTVQKVFKDQNSQILKEPNVNIHLVIDPVITCR